MKKMSKNLIYILVLILFIQLKVSNGFDLPYSHPDLSNPNIPLKWRELCGLRYFPRRVTFPQKCFKNSFEDILYDNPLNFPRKMSTNRVLGGRDVLYRESPWTVQITAKRYNWLGFYADDRHSCTGVLLTMRHILTAAHCLMDNKTELRIYGGTEHTGMGWNSDKYDFIQHPNYPKGEDPKNYNINRWAPWDIAVIVLNTPIEWNKWGYHWGWNWRNEEILVNTICLPKKESYLANISDIYRFRNATFYGWGLVWQQETPFLLKRADVPIRYNTEYPQYFFEFKQEDHEPRPCKGDSGGGLVQYIDEYETRAVLIGINIFFIIKYEDNKRPCIYDYVGKSHSNQVVRHLNWINQILQNYPDTSDPKIDI